MMAKENDEVQQQSHSHSDSNNHEHGTGVEASLEAGDLMDSEGITASKHDPHIEDRVTVASGLAEEAHMDILEGREASSAAAGARGNLNDLVADVCKGRPVCGGFGDYTNIRATMGPLGLGAEGVSSSTSKTDLSFAMSAATASNSFAAPSHPTQNSSFSFKHFLNSSSGSGTAASTTVTVSTASSGTLPVAVSGNAGQTSTGARPKVPQSASVTTTSISSLTASGGLSATDGFASAATKMKRSPRFSSFDSQASLAEYASGSGIGAGSSVDTCHRTEGISVASAGSSTGFRLYPDARAGQNSDIFGDRQSGMVSGGSSYDRHYVPRSYSNYDMPHPPASPRRRLNNAATSGGALSKDSRSSRLSLNSSSAAKLKLDLPIDSAGGAGSSGAAAGGGSNEPRGFDAPSDDFPSATAAAASTLPDFVQDHWMDSWYAHEMHLREAVVLGGSAAAAASCGGPPAGNEHGASGSGGGNSELPLAGGSKMLPDFLSDGLIIHSSQRLADVATGLPSNSRSSPEETSMPTQLSRLRIENERLQRELGETRAVLNEQTRRTHDLECQLQERSAAANEEIAMDKANKRRTAAAAAAQNHVTKLKQQVTQLTAEVETLRRENDSLREEGAVGGCGATACDRSPYCGAAASGGGGASVRTTPGRPLRTQMISRDLLRAASTAESSLRQLLTGVDNLRQMAADIENAERQQEGYDVSPDLFSDFIDDCDDYEDYAGGPAL